MGESTVKSCNQCWRDPAMVLKVYDNDYLERRTRWVCFECFKIWGQRDAEQDPNE